MKWTNLLGSPRYSFVASLGGTAFIGATVGAILGWWSVGHVKNKLLDWMQQWGFAEKPVNNPDQDYQELLQNDLNTQEAFKNGAKAVFYFKVVKGLLPVGVIATGAGVAKLTNQKDLAELLGNSIFPILKTMVHPVILATMAAMPLIGGLIAKQTVPWMWQQFGIQSGS